MSAKTILYKTEFQCKLACDKIRSQFKYGSYIRDICPVKHKNGFFVKYVTYFDNTTAIL